jgi:IS5 family transposase
MREQTPQVSFADLEFIQQGIELDPTLKAIANFLDQHRDIIHRVRRDLERGLKNRKTGRRGLTPQQVLRSLILARVKNWDYRELRERIADSAPVQRFSPTHF